MYFILDSVDLGSYLRDPKVFSSFWSWIEESEPPLGPPMNMEPDGAFKGG